MSFPIWIALAGALLLVMAFFAAHVRQLPVTSSAIYLGVGLMLGPAGIGVIAVDFSSESTVIEHLTEIAVIISLFVGGLNLRLPLNAPEWRAVYRLAGPLMVATIAGVAVVAHFLLGFPWAAAFLMGSVLAPTDPVLAGMVTVNHSRDHDRMRYGLSGEAGFNDGAAFPFVIFSLLWMEHGHVGGWVVDWAMWRLVWAVPVGLLCGYFLGKGLSHVGIHLRTRNPSTGAPGDFLALALIAISYTAAEAIGAWGFLSVFAAGLGFRHGEKAHSEEDGTRDADVPAEAGAAAGGDDEESRPPSQPVGNMFAEIITFGGTAERLLEMMLVVLLGICLGTYWDWRALPVALILFVVIRPLFSQLVLLGTPTSRSQRWLIGWFGIRGLGSLYYLAYALNHTKVAIPAGVAGVALTVVALSVAAHGISSPLLHFYETWRKNRLG